MDSETRRRIWGSRAVAKVGQGGRITYTAEFRREFRRRYLDGEPATRIFASVGLPRELVGAKRIERATDRWVPGGRRAYRGDPEEAEKAPSLSETFRMEAARLDMEAARAILHPDRTDARGRTLSCLTRAERLGLALGAALDRAGVAAPDLLLADMLRLMEAGASSGRKRAAGQNQQSDRLAGQ